MRERGAEFSDVRPLAQNGLMANTFLPLTVSSRGLNTGIIQLVIRDLPSRGLDIFRLGQQVVFWLGMANPLVTAPNVPSNYITRLYLKLWWLRPNLEFRAPGTATSRPAQEIPPNSGWAPVDNLTFLPGPTGGVVNNRYCWVPSPKRLDITPYSTPPPPISPQPNSYSEFEDDVWSFFLPDPTDVLNIANFPAPQIVSRWATFLYPAMGYSLGLTWDADFFVTPGPAPTPAPAISLTFVAGTLGGTNYQESID